MRDLAADWRRWTHAERVTATVFGVAVTLVTPAMILFVAI